MNFPVTEDVRDLITILRETNFAWIADEIHSVIREGKAVDTPLINANRKSSGKATNETATAAFGDEEQLAIALSTIREYTVTAAHLLEILPKEFSETLNRDNLNIQIISDDEVELVTLNSLGTNSMLPREVAGAIGQLDSSLNDAWPQVEGAYGLRIKNRDRSVE
jgi:hypothetical protein